MQAEIEKLAALLQTSQNIVFFGGAGVSTESGIPDFRSAQGLWNEKLQMNFAPEQLVSHTFFLQYPEEFFTFYRAKLLYPKAQPNACHYALARLEKSGRLKAVITQNIDGLHQAAGSQTVFELHGSVHRNYCMECEAFYPLEYMLHTSGIPRCEKCGGRVKPDVVLYEEGLDPAVIDGAVRAIRAADVLIIGGTSLVVYPAAGLIDYFRGRALVLINKSQTSADSQANLVIHAPIDQVLGTAVKA